MPRRGPVPAAAALHPDLPVPAIPAHAAEAASAAGGACGHRLRLRLRGRHVRNAPAAVRSPDRAAGGLFAVRLLHEKLRPRYIAGLPGHVDGRV